MLLWVAVAACALTTGCGSRPPIRWNARIADWFSRGAVEPVAPPYDHWTEPDRELYRKQLGYADATVVGRVRLVRLHSRTDGPHDFALVFRPSEVLYGDLDETLDAEGDLVLRLARSSPSFRRSLKAWKSLPGRELLVLLKLEPRAKPGPKVKGWRASLWRSPPDPPQRFVWTVYEPDRELIAETRTLYRDLRDHGE